ncbi:MAG TPA: hypothetical protein DEF85_02145 [Clostridiaceae bacterium]|jgi:hypothetical protein|nr:hypothetical protein [Clostridiaceae bacterium]HBX47675.1 hypothetical protein [Clostridiaceae bacterium]HCL51051.1 hypothetical protein [Clostridiaceae bacterium]
MDRFYEQLLTTKKSLKYTTLNILNWIFLIGGLLYFFLATISFNVGLTIFSIIIIALSFLFKYFRNNSYKEYEYTFTNGNLVIDIIYNMNKRRTLFDEDVKNFEAFGKKSDIKIAKGNKPQNCIPWDNKGEVYTIVSASKAYYISPDEKLLSLINIYNIVRRC